MPQYDQNEVRIESQAVLPYSTFRLFAVLGVLVTLVGCGAVRPPVTVGEQVSGYTYVPVDPFPVKTQPGDSCACKPDERSETCNYKPLLEALPDNAVRVLIERFDASGRVTYGAGGIGVKGETYRLTADYINADTVGVPLWIRKRVKIEDDAGDRKPEPFKLLSTVGDDKPESVTYEIERLPWDLVPTEDDTEDEKRRKEEKLRRKVEELTEGLYQEFHVPVYVGVGLRAAADVNVVGSEANVTGLGVIGFEADAQRVQGSLVVQTLGVNGKAIAAALPFQSELNRTTVQNAIVAVASIKTLLWEDDTALSPRVVGLYLPFPGGKALVNALISSLSSRRPVWHRPCCAPPAGPC